MPEQVTQLRLFVASPGDVAEERASIDAVVDELNRTIGRTKKLAVRVVKWETDSVPGFGSDPQAVINDQVSIEEIDIFVGVLWARFGTATPRALSGTQEEFERAYQRWKQNPASMAIMMYFCDRPVPPSIDAAQLRAVQEFRSTVGVLGGLFASFMSLSDFKDKFRAHLTKVMAEFRLDGALPSAVPVLPVPPLPTAGPASTTTSSEPDPRALRVDSYRLTTTMEQPRLRRVGLPKAESAFWRAAANNGSSYSYFPLASRVHPSLVREHYIELNVDEQQRSARTILDDGGGVWTEEVNSSQADRPVLDAAGVIRKMARYALVVGRMQLGLGITDPLVLNTSIEGLDRRFYLQADPRDLDHGDPALWTVSSFQLLENQILRAQATLDPGQVHEEEYLVNLVHGMQEALFFPLRVGPSFRTGLTHSISYTVEAVRRCVREAAVG